MAHAQDGDRGAYRRLLEDIAPYLRALGRRFGLPSDEIEDAVQDVLLTVHKIRHTYDPKRPFGPWLLAIARHRLVDRVRRRMRILARETELTGAHETLAADQTNHHERAGEVRCLYAALSTLPAGQRRAIEMLKLKEMSMKEASAASGQSETALKVAAHRALKRLRLLLGSGLVGP